MSAKYAGHMACDLSTAALRETISTYDFDAESYAVRFAKADFGSYLAEFIHAIPLGGTTLDAGCGSGRDLAQLSANGIKAVGLDRSQGMLDVSRKAAPDARLVRGDLRSLPFCGSTFNGVWHCSSLVHLPPSGAASAIKEVRRVLIPDGVAFFSVASGRGAEWRRSSVGRRWFYYYEQLELERIVSEADLRIISSETEAGVIHGRWINIVARK